jgi:chromosome partitioning protein
MSHSIAFINQKGGVGKTTLVANVGAWWGRQGYRVLLIDLDPQAHLTLHLHSGIDEDRRERSNIYRVLRGECAFAEAVQPLPDEMVSIVPSHIDLSAAEWELGQEVGREVILRDLLGAFLEEEPYDIILVDCPPSLGLLSLNALAAVDDVVVPVQAEFFALLGTAQLMRVIELVRSRLHPGLEWRVVVPTLVDPRTNLGRDVIQELEGHVPGKVTRNWLRKRVKVAEAPSHGRSIFSYAGDSPAADEFRKVCDEIAERIGIEVRPAVEPVRSDEADLEPPVEETASPPLSGGAPSGGKETAPPEAEAEPTSPTAVDPPSGARFEAPIDPTVPKSRPAAKEDPAPTPAPPASRIPQEAHPPAHRLAEAPSSEPAVEDAP